VSIDCKQYKVNSVTKIHAMVTVSHNAMSFSNKYSTVCSNSSMPQFEAMVVEAQSTFQASLASVLVTLSASSLSWRLTHVVTNVVYTDFTADTTIRW